MARGRSNLNLRKLLNTNNLTLLICVVILILVIVLLVRNNAECFATDPRAAVGGGPKPPEHINSPRAAGSGVFGTVGPRAAAGSGQQAPKENSPPVRRTESGPPQGSGHGGQSHNNTSNLTDLEKLNPPSNIELNTSRSNQNASVLNSNGSRYIRGRNDGRARLSTSKFNNGVRQGQQITADMQKLLELGHSIEDILNGSVSIAGLAVDHADPNKVSGDNMLAGQAPLNGP